MVGNVGVECAHIYWCNLDFEILTVRAGQIGGVHVFIYGAFQITVCIAGRHYLKHLNHRLDAFVEYDAGVEIFQIAQGIGDFHSPVQGT
ncbi:hypothetical protein D3C75_532520 [compost metagenome]